MIEVDARSPRRRTQPLDEASDAIKQQLVSGQQQQIAADFQTDFIDKWTARTICAEGQEIELCSNYVAPDGRAGPGQPTRAAGALDQADRAGHLDDLDRRHRRPGPAAGSAAAGRRPAPPRSSPPAPCRSAPTAHRRRRDHDGSADHGAPPGTTAAPPTRRSADRRPPTTAP